MFSRKKKDVPPGPQEALAEPEAKEASTNSSNVIATEDTLPQGWTEEWNSAYGALYYYRLEMDISSWTRPYVDEWGGVAFDEATEAAEAELGAVGDGEAEEDSAANDSSSGESSGDDEDRSDDDGAAGSGSVEKGQLSEWVLPPGWTEEYSSLYSAVFYRHEETDVSSWDRPYLDESGEVVFEVTEGAAGL